jgi:hypothetical protein
MSRSNCRRLVTAAVLGFTLAASSEAVSRESLVIKERDRLSYSFELEPHLLVGLSGPFGDKPVFGPGIRAAIPIVPDGFISKLNDSVAIGFGADFGLGAKQGTVVAIPLVLQWTFWLSTHWTVFGEPGVDLAFGPGRSKDSLVHPLIAVGGRYHFSERVALTLRGGYPGFSVGLSLFF